MGRWFAAAMLTFSLGQSIVGCKREADEAAPATAAPASAASHATSAPTISVTPLCPFGSGNRALRVSWTHVVKSASCFFFSGPGDIGRDTKLGNAARWESNGDTVALVFGPARFSGSAGREPLTLVRTQRYDFHGPWRTTETIVGQWASPSPLAQTLAVGQCPEFRGTYVYQECNLQNSAECPGPCRISADVRLESVAGE
jgi:hypothetical protein